MSGHSPGPWSSRRVKYETYALLDANGAEVAVVTRGHDAEFLARAPDLLAEVERLREELAKAYKRGFDDGLNEICETVREAQAALAAEQAATAEARRERDVVREQLGWNTYARDAEISRANWMRDRAERAEAALKETEDVMQEVTNDLEAGVEDRRGAYIKMLAFLHRKRAALPQPTGAGEPCEACKGTGTDSGRYPIQGCRRCGGDGTISPAPPSTDGGR